MTCLLGKSITGRFTIGSGIITTTCDTIERLFEVPELGVLTTKSIGPAERDGNREPVYASLCDGRDGYVNAVGLGNPGHVQFEKELRTLKVPDDKFLLISIFGGTTEEFVEVARTLHPYCDALELNFSCPHAEGHGLAICATPGLAAEIVREIKKVTNKPLIPKLSPNLDLDTIDTLIETLLAAGAQGFTACNTLGPVDNIHAEAGINVISRGRGGMSGAAGLEEMVKIVAHIRAMMDKHGGSSLPLIGMGGITHWDDCKRYLDAGATILGVGSSLTGLDTWQLKTAFASLGREENPPLVAKVSMELRPFTLKKRTLVNPQLALLEFEEPLPCVAGQFIEVWIPNIGEKPFAQSCEQPLKLAVGDVGVLTHHMVNTLERGDTIYVRGPYGKAFCLKPPIDAGGPLVHVLVGGGTGIAPLLLLATQLRQNSSAQRPFKIWIYLGGRTEEHLYYEKEFAIVADRVRVATNDGSRGYSGFVTALLDDDLQKEAETSPTVTYRFYNCGPELMMVAATKVQKGYPHESLECSIERYMKCGVGICGICSCDGLRTCVDGPVWGEDLLDASTMFGKKHRAKNAKLLDW